MVHWMRVLPVFCAVWLMSAAWAATTPPLDDIFSEELDASLYDCTLTATPTTSLSATGTIRLDLEQVDDNEYTRISISKRQIDVISVKKGKKTRVGQSEIALPSDVAAHLTVLRRGTVLIIMDESNKILFRGDVPRAGGAKGLFHFDRGWTVEEPHVQRLEPVAFSDNFMRTSDEPGNWTSRSGEWVLQSAWDRDPKGNSARFNNIIYAQNPFAWSGRNPNGAALCTTGKAFWEDYTMSVAVQPGPDSAAGVMVNMADPDNGYLVRWTPANIHGAQGDRLTLSRVANGKVSIIAETRGGYIPEQWYKLTVTSTLDGLQVLVDDQPRLSAKGVTPWRGGVGLYAEGKNGAVFDDVSVYGHTLKKDLIDENQAARVSQRMHDDHNGMEEWAARNDWLAYPGVASQMLYRCDVFGDQWMVLNVRPYSSQTGELCLTLCGSEKEANAGYRALVKLENGKLTYTIFRDTTVLATKPAKPLSTTTDYSLRFRRTGNTLLLEQDGEKILEATDKQPLAGLRPSYRAEGCFALANTVMVMSHNMLDYTFADEPVDWIQQGTWMQTTRWSCSPNWSFLAGWSRGDTVLWHKKQVFGDQSFDVFEGLKMEYPRERDIYDNRYRNFSVSICSDGHNPRTGYSGIYGAPDVTGKVPNQRTVLLRNGVEVASANLTVPGRGTSHRRWFELELRKHGAVIEFWVSGKQVLTYTDPNPIEGGVPAIWTSDNCISVAMAQLHFANPAQPRTDTQVLIDEPFYPEWLNINKPFTLDFPESWSTSGKSVSLKTNVQNVPAGDEGALTVQGTRVTCTVKKPGEHWYEITASDGTTQSPSFHISGMAFDPAIGRDDSHAVVLYRFDEGKGEIVHDQSKIGAPADLKIVKDKDSTAAPFWVTGQGLTIRGVTPLMTTADVPKLMALVKSKACTLEFWVSTDTVYPATGWSGCLLSWEAKTDKRNFAVGHISTNILFAPRNAQILGNDAAAFMAAGFRTSLQHYVLTWDGTTTRWYMNGKPLGEKKVDWLTDQWMADAPLLLGNQSDLQRNFLGTYYLVAIHDCCLSAENIMRHYQAGPSAK